MIITVKYMIQWFRLPEICRLSPIVTFCILYFIFSSSLFAQDIHFSQFDQAPMQLSPALTGVFTGDQRFNGNYRDQWVNVPVPFTTFSASYDQKFAFSWLPNGQIGAGLLFNYDTAGDGDLNWTQLGLNTSYSHRLTPEQFLTAGFQVRVGQRAFQPQQLTFDEQFNGDIFDGTLPITELFDNNSKGFFSLGLGLNWYYQLTGSRSRIYMGGGYFHFNSPNVSFFEDASVSLAALANFYQFTTIQLGDQTDILTRILVQFQGSYHETLIGAGIKYHVSEEINKELAVGFITTYRISDALVPQLALYYKNWQFGWSYDITLSPFRAANQRRGGPEFSIQYIIRNVPPPDTFKACPIF